MLELSPDQLPSLTGWFPVNAPGPATLAEHVLATGVGRWWADRAIEPRVLGASCAGQTVLRGSPDALVPEALAHLAGNRIDAPEHFLPKLGAAFDRLTPWERMRWTRQAVPQPATVPFGVALRRLEPADADAVQALGPDAAWITASWGGPLALASSGHAWAAVCRRGRVLAVACAYFRGSRHEEVAVFTVQNHRRHRLALACVNALCEDIVARNRTPSWNCSVLNRVGRLLAWYAGFRLVDEYVHYAVGSPASPDRLSPQRSRDEDDSARSAPVLPVPEAAEEPRTAMRPRTTSL